ncbi:MAG TPA: ATP-binding protein [Acidobacteriaceae bacterium]|jgi:heavy metal sensor kinase|nr:ATP-binding protein [Acidobacteriaceae bacterium]
MRPFAQSGNLRLRLTLWYGTAFSILLLLHIGVATYVHYSQLINRAYHAEIQDLETTEGLVYQAPDGRITMNEEYFNNPEIRMHLDRHLEILSPDGKVLYQDQRLDGAGIDGPLLPHEGVGTYNERATRLSDGRRVLVISHFHYIHGQPMILRVAYDEAPLFANVVSFLGVLLLLAPITVLIAMWVVFTVASRALSPLSSMVRRAEKITAERLSERLPVHDPSDDLGHAARVFNGLLQRLEDSFSQLRRFTSDASHELRTPLASMRSIGEVSLQTSHSNEQYRDVIASMLEEVRRLTQLVDSLLAISRADSGQIALRLTSFSCIDLIQEVIAVVGILAEDKHQTIFVADGPQIILHADRGILRQAILNVVDNAIKYSPASTEIRIEVSVASDSIAEIAISDRGPGIPPEEQSQIFDRFYRIDSGRSRERGGTGLGLSIAKWAVEAHGGNIGVRAAEEGGSCFYIHLPLSV